MFTCVSTLIFFLGLREIGSLRRCPSLSAPLRGTVACFRGNERLSCAFPPPVHSFAEFTCREFYRLSAEEQRVVKCLPNSSWSLSPPKCIPDCGRRSNSVSLILNGAISTHGAFPWHVAMYHFSDGVYEYWCGGSLVSETAVITAAHCVWKIPPEKLMLAFGKFHREYNFVENYVQKVRAKKIETLKTYQDVNGNYNGDIAVVFLERAVVFEHFTVPVCLDWDQELMERQLVERTMGVVLGWGITENDSFSDSLRMMRLPVVSEEKCIAEQERDFQKFITYTSFCAGYSNGSAVCNGDSGGGLTFFDKVSGRWYLQGVVSVSPRRRGTPYCDPRFYTVFTKVSMFSKWLRGMKELTEAVVTHENSSEGQGKSFHDFKNKSAFVKKKKKISFPHTVKMLQLANLSAFSHDSRST